MNCNTVTEIEGIDHLQDKIAPGQFGWPAGRQPYRLHCRRSITIC